jgi:two-component system chemotaxis response regulator CheB
MFDRTDLDPSLSILIVQHMPETFTGAFATRLNQVTNLIVKEASDGDPLLEGHVYIAPGHSHMRIVRKNEGYAIKLGQDEKVSGHRPSADALFISVASELGRKAVGVIMTGMGRDGADGMKILKGKGAYTISQDEKTSVVYGMNKEAIKLGCINKILPLEEIADFFTDCYKKL